MNFKRKLFEFNEIIDCSRVAHYDTINVEAFVDNLVEKFRNLK